MVILRQALVFFCLMVLTLPAYALTVTLAKNEVSQQESVVLTVNMEGRHQRDALNIKPLQKNFRLFNSRVQHYYRYPGWISQWTITLLDKKAGALSIPPLTIGRDSSNPIPIFITNGRSKTNAPAILNAEVNHTTAYPQSQILFTQTLYQRPHVSNGILSEPKIPQVIIQRLDQDEQSETKLNGLTYHITKRRYAIFPQQAGTITIPKSQFSGLISQQGGSIAQSISGPNSKISTSADEITIQVHPIPKSFTANNWLSTKKFEISTQWLHDNAFKTGEPKVQVITMNAVGLFGTQLPQLPIPESELFKYYIENISTKTTQTATGLISQKIYHLTYIPLQAGTQLLPEIQQSWWNPKTKQRFTTTVPAQTVQVGIGKIVQKQNQQQWVDAMSPDSPVTDKPETQSTPSIWPDIVNNLPSLEVLIFSGILFAAIAMIKHWASPEKKQQIMHEVKEKVTSRFAYNIKKGCQSHDKHFVYQQLLLWAKTKWPKQHFHDLTGLAEFINDDAFNKKVAKLNRARFTENTEHWNGKSFWRVFKRVVNQTTTTKPLAKPKPTLPNLYAGSQ